MLTQIHIRDFALIEHLELELGVGMSVLTGETGAGKSILIDALGLALGDRASSDCVRHGAERADISIAFDIQQLAPVRQWLTEHELDAGDDCLLRRSVSRDGRSRGFINAQPVPLQLLKELGEQLVDIHGQHEHQSLLRRDNQRLLLDDFAGHDALLTSVAEAYAGWKTVHEQLLGLQNDHGERAARLDMLRFQTRELEALELAENDIQQLEQEHSRLANAGHLLETTQRAQALLYEAEEANVQSILSQTLNDIQALCEVDNELLPVRDLLQNALIQTEESSDLLRRYADRLDLDPQRLQWVEQRLAALHDLARKHRCTIESLPALLDTLRAERDLLDSSDNDLDALTRKQQALGERYLKLAGELSASRAQAAATLDGEVCALMAQLGMAGGRLHIALSKRSNAFAVTGQDEVEFQVSANPGQPLKALAKVVSGGELSRISLAIQVAGARSARIPTLIFDEVDTGVGGGVAEVVGSQLATLGQSRQVLCVTHLPQVAAQANHHLHVSKQSRNNSTQTRIQQLDHEARIEELSRMLGGIEVTAQARAHAAEMIERAGKPTPKPRGRKRPSETVAS